MILTGCSNATNEENSKPLQKGDAEIYVIDVGQGSSSLIKTEDTTILIDAGENNQGDKVVSFLKSHDVDKIDVMIGTHPHSDHIGGADTVINSFEVDKLYMPNKISTTKTYEDVLDAVERNNVDLIIPNIGDKYEFSNGNSITFLSPDPDKDYGENMNAYSIVTKIHVAGVDYLTGGDCDYEEYDDLLSSDTDLSADIYQAFHHGSYNHTNGEALFKRVKPDTVITSVGEGNSYGHPHQEFLSYVTSHGIELYRTDIQGNIRISIHDGTYHIATEKTGDMQQSATSDDRKNVADGPVIGNINSKKFHKENCGNLPYEKNRVYFDTVEEAEDAGYTASGDCF